MNKKMLAAVITAAMLIISTVAAFAGSPQDEEAVGAVYTMTNDATKNEVVIFNRDEDGILTKAGSILTGGQGYGLQRSGGRVRLSGLSGVSCTEPGSEMVIGRECRKQ